MNELDQIALAQSHKILSSMRGVQVQSEWRPTQSSTVWMLQLRLELLGAEPSSDVPLYTDWEVVLDFRQDMWGKVQLHPVNNEYGINKTFPHQQFNGGNHSTWPCRNGHICTLTWQNNLAATRNAMPVEPTTTIDRLSWHVSRALEWLALAATSSLTQLGDYYELPDFNTGQHNIPGSLAYYEDEQSYKHWQSQGVDSGIASLLRLRGNPLTHVIKRFYDFRGRSVVFAPTWGKSISSEPAENYALWIRLDAMPVVNYWQAPSTIDQLREALTAQGKDLNELLEPMWKHFSESKEVFLLLGVPIPIRVGEKPHHYHWQALQLAKPATRLPQKSRVQLLKTHLNTPHELKWMPRAENWHPEVLQNRGRLSVKLSNAKVLLLGAGALGSAIAEQLVRMGVNHLTIVDKDVLEAGNLVRHSLALPQLGQSKALALAAGLNQVNPSTRVVGMHLTLPNQDIGFLNAVKEATLIIDATAEDAVLQLMPLPGIPRDTPIISCSLSLNAEHLFFYADLAETFNWIDFNQWHQPFREEQNQLAQQLEFPRGIGCWHPLTPAPLNRIAGLAGVAVELIDKTYADKSVCPLRIRHAWPLLVSDQTSILETVNESAFLH
ncbi:ThiF family adenylyltransferase [Hymenobacter sp. HSC-4F20]|uniref:HesA/MoeB/ThiF family protein n=1 Tax=Hymenobacter sp. HSC-4F20 TaxID=2864135 RepID=UPI001C734BA7|nr:ThiF family adenylyltransferase [Hymenobacter sp. HSC-4F20]MBX0291694.1 ThiF family adenylyltransferase [Hymenobacter sp. HSC-4F20]